MENLDNVVAYIDYKWMFYALTIEDLRTYINLRSEHAWYDLTLLRHDELCLEMVGCLDSGLL